MKVIGPCFLRGSVAFMVMVRLHVGGVIVARNYTGRVSVTVAYSNGHERVFWYDNAYDARHNAERLRHVRNAVQVTLSAPGRNPVRFIKYVEAS